MQALPYLNFKGNCREAFEFYAKTLGGNIVALHTYGEMPDGHTPPGSGDLVMHVRLDLGDGTIMGSDCPPGMPAETPAGFNISIHPSSVEEGQRIFDALADGGSVTMPYGPTFWAAAFGMVTDRYGIPWMLNIDIKA